MTAEERREKAIAELVDVWQHATPKENAMLILADKAYEAGRSAGLDEAAQVAEDESNRVPGWSLETKNKIAAAIRALKP